MRGGAFPPIVSRSSTGARHASKRGISVRALRLAVVVVIAALCFAVPASAEGDGPVVILETPADGWAFPQGQQVQAAYACLPGVLGFPAVSCVGDVSLGAYIDTNTVGPHTFSVRAVDYAGAETTVTHSYQVIDVIAPRADVEVPAKDAAYAVGQQLYVHFSCDDGAGGSEIVGCIGTFPNGYPLPTDRPGEYTFHVDAFDAALNHGTADVSYRVIDSTPPQITIISPGDGAQFLLGRQVTPSYFCHDDVDGSRVTCTATPIDTSSYGPHEFRVDSIDRSGNRSWATTHYSVVYAFEGFYAPLAADGAELKAGDGVPAKFSLHGEFGLGVLARAEWHPCGALDWAPADGTLTYNAGPDRYTFLWATDRAWAGSCRELRLTLADGTQHTASVRFR
jgi:hypothetical protein